MYYAKIESKKRGMYRMISYYINNTVRSTWRAYYDDDGGKVYENRHKMPMQCPNQRHLRGM